MVWNADAPYESLDRAEDQTGHTEHIDEWSQSKILTGEQGYHEV